jgi:hypothetical protein
VEMAFIEPVLLLTKDMSQGIVQIGSVFHGYLPFFVVNQERL